MNNFNKIILIYYEYKLNKYIKFIYINRWECINPAGVIPLRI